METPKTLLLFQEVELFSILVNFFMNQLFAVTHEIFKAFDCNLSLEVRLVFLDISKVFGKVWHGGLRYKLKSMGISGELCNLLENYLAGRLQRVVLNGQTSSRRSVLASVPKVQF